MIIILWRYWCFMMTDLCLLISTTWCINSLTILAKSPKANKHFLIPGFICLQYFKLLEIINNNSSSPLLPWPFRMKRAIKLKKKKGKHLYIISSSYECLVHSFPIASCFPNDPFFLFYFLKSIYFQVYKSIYSFGLSRHNIPVSIDLITNWKK